MQKSKVKTTNKTQRKLERRLFGLFILFGIVFAVSLIGVIILFLWNPYVFWHFTAPTFFGGSL